MSLQSISPNFQSWAPPFCLCLKVVLPCPASWSPAVTIITPDPSSTTQPHFLIQTSSQASTRLCPPQRSPSFQSGCFFRVATWPHPFPSLPPYLLGLSLAFRSEVADSHAFQRQARILSLPLAEEGSHSHRCMLIPGVAGKQQCKNYDK